MRAPIFFALALGLSVWSQEVPLAPADPASLGPWAQAILPFASIPPRQARCASRTLPFLAPLWGDRAGTGPLPLPFGGDPAGRCEPLARQKQGRKAHPGGGASQRSRLGSAAVERHAPCGAWQRCFLFLSASDPLARGAELRVPRGRSAQGWGVPGAHGGSRGRGPGRSVRHKGRFFGCGRGRGRPHLRRARWPRTLQPHRGLHLGGHKLSGGPGGSGRRVYPCRSHSLRSAQGPLDPRGAGSRFFLPQLFGWSGAELVPIPREGGPFGLLGHVVPPAWPLCRNCGRSTRNFAPWGSKSWG